MTLVKIWRGETIKHTAAGVFRTLAVFALLLVAVAFLAGAFFVAVLVAVFFAAGAFLVVVAFLAAGAFLIAGLVVVVEPLGPPSFTGPEEPVDASEVSNGTTKE